MVGSPAVDIAVLSANNLDATALFNEVAEYTEKLENENKLRYRFCNDANRTIIVTDDRCRIQFLTDLQCENIRKRQGWRVIGAIRDIEFRKTYKSLIDDLVDLNDKRVACDAESKKVKINILYMMSNPDAKPVMKAFLDEISQLPGATLNTIRNHTYMIGDHICQITCVFKDEWMSDNLYKSSFDGIIIKPETLQAHHTVFIQMIRTFLQSEECNDEKE